MENYFLAASTARTLLTEIWTALAIGEENNPASLGRPDRVGLKRRIGGESRRNATGGFVDPDVHVSRLGIDDVQGDSLPVLGNTRIGLVGRCTKGTHLFAASIEPHKLRDA